jgi:hypothetical protein
MGAGFIIRDARDWSRTHLEQIQEDLQHVDVANIQHIETCPGCPACVELMDFYSGCSTCGRTAHKEAMAYDPATGQYTCGACIPGKPASEVSVQKPAAHDVPKACIL